MACNKLGSDNTYYEKYAGSILSPLIAGAAQSLPCRYQFFVRHSGGFTDYVPVCAAHHWVGAEHGTLEGAQSQLCEVALELGIARRRLQWLAGAGFQPVLGSAVAQGVPDEVVSPSTQDVGAQPRLGVSVHVRRDADRVLW